MTRFVVVVVISVDKLINVFWLFEGFVGFVVVNVGVVVVGHLLNEHVA